MILSKLLVLPDEICQKHLIIGNLERAISPTCPTNVDVFRGLVQRTFGSLAISSAETIAHNWQDRALRVHLRIERGCGNGSQNRSWHSAIAIVSTVIQYDNKMSYLPIKSIVVDLTRGFATALGPTKPLFIFSATNAHLAGKQNLKIDHIKGLETSLVPVF